MEGEFDIWKFLAGLGIFLFGMFLLEESVRNLAGRSFKRFIRKYTTGRFKSVLSGGLITALLQSSSAVSLMVLTFVGAGIMSMRNAIGVILGSNAGTTTTAWIVALLGFSLEIESLALPMIGIGGLGTIFLGSSDRYSNISKLLVGFGFLFMGLDFMKVSVEHFTDDFAMDAFTGYGILLYLLVGIVLTAIMQSSSATIAIVLTGLNAGILDFESAAAVVVGANIGTTVTVLIGSIGGNQIKKRVAASHLVFNVVTAVLGIVLLYPLSWLILQITGPDPEDAVIGIAIFHTVFNVMGVLLFIPFMSWLAQLLVRLVPDKRPGLTMVIHRLPPGESEAAIPGIHAEVFHLILTVLRHNLIALRIDPQLVFPLGAGETKPTREIPPEQQYDNLKTLQADIFTFAARVQESTLGVKESEDLHRFLHGARLALHSAKTLKDVQHYFEEFENADNDYLNQQYTAFRQRMIAEYLKIAELHRDSTEEPIHPDRVSGDMAQILHHIRKEDQQFVRATTKAVAANELKDTDISNILIANRAFIQSSRQILSALREALLTPAESAMFEELTDPQLTDIP